MQRPSADRVATATLLCALLLGAFYAGILYEGRRVARSAAVELQDLQRRNASATAWLRAERTAAEAALRSDIAALRSQLRIDQKEADEDHRTYAASVRSGAVSVRVPIVPTSCQPAGIQPARISGAGADAADAQLDPAAAANLDAIAGEGDSGIRDLNFCIAQYGKVKQAFDVWRTKLAELDHAQTR